MYHQHFGLTEEPFRMNPNIDFFLNIGVYRDALNVLSLALENGDGFIKVVGEIGTGKTLLCRKLVAMLPERFHCIVITDPKLPPDDLLRAIASGCGIKTEHLSGHPLRQALTEELIKLKSLGKQVVVIIDEAQAIPEDSLEVVRLVTNNETEREKLLQVALFGQPELDEILNKPSFRQLKQRFVYTLKVQPLSSVDLITYLEHRLTVAGYKGAGLFEPKAIRTLYQASRGLPRLVNLLAHKALLSAYGEGVDIVRAKHVLAAANDTESSFKVQTSALKLGVLCASAAIIGVIAAQTFF